MAIRVTDRWRHPPRATIEQAIATFRRWGSFPMGDVEDAVREIRRLCELVVLDDALLIAHAALETGHTTQGRAFLDKNWATVDRYQDPRNRYNIAGMGITDTQDLGYRWANGIEAARAFVVHHARYEIPPDDPAWDYLRPYIPLDKRYDAVPVANRGTVRTVAQMTGKWWTNTNGHTNLAARGNQIFPDLPDQGEGTEEPMADLNFDPKLVPMPKYRFKLAVNKREGVGMNRFGPRVHRGNVFHRALSGNQSLDTAVGWLLRPDVRGLTDGFIDHRTGEMVIINPMKAMFPGEVPANWQDMAGWANGPYSATASWPDGRAFRNRFGGKLGADIINQDLESMEITGDYNTPLSEAAKATMVQWTASRAQYHKIPWDKFPIDPATGLTMIYGHREFCGDGHKICPGPVVWEFINGELIRRVREILKKAQTTAVTVPPVTPKPEPTDPWPYPEPDIPAFIKNPDARPYLEDGNGTTLFWTNRQYRAKRDTKRLKYAYDGAPEVGPLIPKGTDFNIAFVFTAHNGKEYGLTPYGTRVLLDDLEVVSDGALRA